MALAAARHTARAVPGYQPSFPRLVGGLCRLPSSQAPERNPAACALRSSQGIREAFLSSCPLCLSRSASRRPLSSCSLSPSAASASPHQTSPSSSLSLPSSTSRATCASSSSIFAWARVTSSSSLCLSLAADSASSPSSSQRDGHLGFSDRPYGIFAGAASRFLWPGVAYYAPGRPVWAPPPSLRLASGASLPQSSSSSLLALREFSSLPSASSSSPKRLPQQGIWRHVSADAFSRFSRDPVAFFRRCRLQYPVPVSWREGREQLSKLSKSGKSALRKSVADGKEKWRKAPNTKWLFSPSPGMLEAGKKCLRTDWETHRDKLRAQLRAQAEKSGLSDAEARRAFVERQKAKLRAQRQQLIRLMNRQQKVVQEKGLLWLEMRRRKVEATLLQLGQSDKISHLRQVKTRVVHQGKEATERLKGLWGKYGWASVLSYAVVHFCTLFGLFGLAQMISDESVQRVADFLHLEKIIDKDAIANEKSFFWGRLLFAYAACKPLTPVQVGLAIWCTPPLARFMVRHGIPLHMNKTTVSQLRRQLRFRRRKSSSNKNTL
ncbi:hypothetical protein BESB_028290 [Besnoitia besnoiti]|uniref:DUF1279 domain-containing protein n=1 Tax=Besnoitia besnoiti TaxID=94643 RepID=A0A2A9M2D6_BESBE|nr:uncharacterized protein BESB_028290 [Besnoitia besnoiti]PFH31394.1 hypothetical protein BESB_028290 [Besnoitia besnoiti]